LLQDELVWTLFYSKLRVMVFNATFKTKKNKTKQVTTLYVLNTTMCKFVNNKTYKHDILKKNVDLYNLISYNYLKREYIKLTIKLFLTFTSLNLVLLWQLFYLFCCRMNWCEHYFIQSLGLWCLTPLSRRRKTKQNKLQHYMCWTPLCASKHK
jgi:hypothetical protein